MLESPNTNWPIVTPDFLCVKLVKHCSLAPDFEFIDHIDARFASKFYVLVKVMRHTVNYTVYANHGAGFFFFFISN